MNHKDYSNSLITRINSGRFRIYFRAVTYLLIFCFLLLQFACVTTEVKTINAKYFYPETDTKITGVIFKDGRLKKFGDNECKYFEEFSGKKNVLVFENYKDTVRVDAKSNRIRISNEIIELNDVQEVIIEKYSVNAGQTALLVAGIAGVIALIIVLSNRNKEPSPPPQRCCPFIYSYDGEKFIFDAEPLGGAICSGLSRTDYSRLKNLTTAESKFKLLVRNEADEVQYLDELKLCVVSNVGEMSVAQNSEGEFYKYKQVVLPESVIDEKGTNITGFFENKDNICWQTQMAVDTPAVIEKNKHSLKFKFRKPEGAKSVLLFFNGGSTMWGSLMIKHMLQIRGDKLDDWFNSINSHGVEYRKMYSFMEREELYFLKVNLLESSNYAVKSYIPAGGPFGFEDKLIQLPLENVQGDYIEFILNPPPGYWKMDQVGLIYDYEKLSSENISFIDAEYAVDQDGKALNESIRDKDENYYVMQNIGDYSNITFNVPEGFNMNTSEIFLKTTGYYIINNINNNGPEQTELINEIMNTPGRIIEYSYQVYNQKLKTLKELKTLKDL